jgi:hypothetical protein
VKGRYKNYFIIIPKENMKKEDLMKKLENLDIPEIETPNHRRRLKMALLSSPRFAQSPVQRFFGVMDNMSTMKKIIPIGAIAAVAAVVVAVGFQGAAPHADAEQIARLSVAAVATLSPADGSALTQILNTDPEATLKEAESASDLTTLTYNQFIALYPQGARPVTLANPAIAAGAAIQLPSSTTLFTGTLTPITTPAALQAMANMKAKIEAAQAALKTARFLQFTNPQGEKVTVAISADNVPIFVSVTLKNGMQIRQESF